MSPINCLKWAFHIKWECETKLQKLNCFNYSTDTPRHFPTQPATRMTIHRARAQGYRPQAPIRLLLIPDTHFCQTTLDCPLIIVTKWYLNLSVRFPFHPRMISFPLIIFMGDTCGQVLVVTWSWSTMVYASMTHPGHIQFISTTDKKID